MSIVSEGNLMVARASACQLYLVCRGDTIVQTEQPCSSLMFEHPRQLQIRSVLERPHVGILVRPGSFYFVHVWLGAYGARTAKGARLSSNSPLVNQLVRKLSRRDISALAAATRTFSQNEVRAAAGLSSATGVPKELQLSQEYPPAFVLENLTHWEAHRQAWASRTLYHNDALPMADNFESSCSDLWPDLKLQDLAATLRLPYHRLIE